VEIEKTHMNHSNHLGRHPVIVKGGKGFINRSEKKVYWEDVKAKKEQLRWAVSSQKRFRYQ